MTRETLGLHTYANHWNNGGSAEDHWAQYMKITSNASNVPGYRTGLESIENQRINDHIQAIQIVKRRHPGQRRDLTVLLQCDLFAAGKTRTRLSIHPPWTTKRDPVWIPTSEKSQLNSKRKAWNRLTRKWSLKEENVSRRILENSLQNTHQRGGQRKLSAHFSGRHYKRI